MTINIPFCLSTITPQLILHPPALRCPECGGHLRQLRLWFERRQHIRALGQRPLQDRAGSRRPWAGHNAPAGGLAFAIARSCVWMWLFMMPCGVLRSWPWERKALNVSCPSWNAWWSGVKTNTSTLTLRPASVSQSCVICQDYMTFFPTLAWY